MDIFHKIAFQPAIFQEIIQKLSQIDLFKGKWDLIENKEKRYLKELREIATIQSIGSSTRIEGATLTDDEVKQLLKSLHINNLDKREEQEVVGYYEALELILENYNEIDLSERYLHQLHSILLKYSSKDQRHKGQYKSLSNQVVANYPDGGQKIIFKTTEPHLTAGEMQELIEWTNHQLEEKKLHPAFITAIFVYEFLSIHPYQDGNGRLSRLLTTLLLLKQGYNFIAYVSFEHEVENRKDMYYRVLMETQKHRETDEELLDKWVIFFLDCLINLTGKLNAKYEIYNNLKVGTNDRQKEVIEYINEQRTIQIMDLAKDLPQYSRNTLKKDLQYLVKEGLILTTGLGRGVRYHAIEGLQN
ncbi:Fic family protein [Paucihalobacter ruber]|uniref:Fic family protein n=1 Tax=Paucihalobacter ruber TaxID=2567861 RepID=A0A506PE72_9FLAO|nr:Fic family protein [Paucihalobacter ruber]TPV31844.1 Fic family protein [Paucihalobacter ruber]